MSAQSAYVFKDGLGRTHDVVGTPEAINALLVKFTRLDVLEHIYTMLAGFIVLIENKKVAPK